LPTTTSTRWLSLFLIAPGFLIFPCSRYHCLLLCQSSKPAFGRGRILILDTGYRPARQATISNRIPTGTQMLVLPVHHGRVSHPEEEQGLDGCREQDTAWGSLGSNDRDLNTVRSTNTKRKPRIVILRVNTNLAFSRVYFLQSLYPYLSTSITIPYATRQNLLC
jgi:hypothetical protein